MKRLRSYGEDLDTVGGDKVVLKDWGRRDQDPDRSSSSHHRRFHSKVESGKKGLSSSSSYDRVMEDDREASRSLRKRLDHDSDGYDRRNRYRDDRGISISSPRNERGVSISSPRNDRGVLISSPRGSYGGERMHRSESFSGSRREIPKGFRSERDRSRREESVSSWRRLCGSKEDDDRKSVELGRGSRLHVRSPSGSKEIAKSSPRSIESSRSSEAKKNDEMQGGSSSSSEMEEGELEPEPEMNSESKESVEPKLENEGSSGVKSESGKELESKNQIESAMKVSNEATPLSKENFEVSVEVVSDGKRDSSLLNGMEFGKKESREPLPLEGKRNCADGMSEIKETVVISEKTGEKKDSIVNDPEGLLSLGQNLDDASEEEVKDVNEGGSLPLEEAQKEELEEENINFVNLKEHYEVENRPNEVTLNLITDKLNGKDKGKSPVICPSVEVDSVGNSRWVEQDFLSCRDNAMEGPSRGFELFSTSIVARSEKTSNSGASKDEKLKTETLELSLALPDVLLPLPSHDRNLAPSSPTRAMSVQSVPSTCRTTSDGFTGSMSFSGSQTFFHNPSCSLTQNSVENYEQSVGSRPLFQGIDQVSLISWPGQSSNEPKHKDASTHQRISMTGNGSHALQTTQGILCSQTMQGQLQQLRVSEGSTAIPIGLDRQASLRRQLSGVQVNNNTETRSPTQSVGSRETISEYSKDKKQMMKERAGSLFRSNSQREMEQQHVIGGTGFLHRIIGMIVSEPVQIMARRIQEMAEKSIAFLKECACVIIANKDMRGKLQVFKEALQNRSDLTLEILLKSHRAQLEILVAFKTGLQDFLRKADGIPSSDLAEIFLNLKCRNLACRSLLPVDECDCKVCVQKNGFCSACMCLICSKFDMASNTCSWVGCDVCLHWCHTECGIRESYIRNGRSVTGAQETTEMQFQCVACNHSSELFGFVKEVFITCGKEWKAEILSKELEYVKRIFSASNDVRGKQLHRVADQMKARLDKNSNFSDVYNYVVKFLTDSDSEFGKNSASCLKEPSQKNPGEGSNGIARPIQEAAWLTSIATENAARRESANAGPPRLAWDEMGSRSGNQDLQMHMVKKPAVDELASIVRIKQAEAKMFQARADDARREAEGLKRIAIAKNEKIEEEYSSRIAKLRLAEAEERRKQKLEELQALEREKHDYFSMKMRMETDIRDLLLKMEATKQNFIT